MADNETIADIITEMRKLAHEFEDYGGMLVPDMLLHFSDRLDAAHKREVREAVTDCSQFSDAAKLREALERVLCWLKRMNAQPLNALAISELTPSHAVNRTARSIIEDNDYHISQLTAALAAPPRNCDKVKTSWDVRKKWHDGLDTANDIVRMLDWLLAPATEKEGSAK